MVAATHGLSSVINDDFDEHEDDEDAMKQMLHIVIIEKLISLKIRRCNLTMQDRMSSENGVNPPASNPSHNSSFSLLSILGRERPTGPNYMDWIRNLRFTLRYENKEYVLDEKISTINDNSTQDEIEAHQKHYDDANKVSCIMEASMSPELQKIF
ncbi:hypothetical protein Tco_1167051 [Tanacetum coccineum]